MKTRGWQETLENSGHLIFGVVFLLWEFRQPAECGLLSENQMTFE